MSEGQRRDDLAKAEDMVLKKGLISASRSLMNAVYMLIIQYGVQQITIVTEKSRSRIQI